MQSKQYVYSSSKRNKSFYVSANQMLLLKLIGSLGFVTTKQLDLLWSVIQHYPTTFSHTTLSNWTAYDSLLNFVPISANLNINRSKRTTTAASHNCYVLSKSCAKWLDTLGILPLSWDSTSINSHNEQATETIVQSLYTAMFGYKSLNYCLPYYCFKDQTYSFCSQAIKRCIQKGVIKGAKEPVNKGAKTTISVSLVPKEKVNQIPTKLLHALSIPAKEKELSSINDYLPYATNLIATLLTDGIDLTPLTDSYALTITKNHNTIYKSDKAGLRPKIINTGKGLLSPKSYKRGITTDSSNIGTSDTYYLDLLNDHYLLRTTISNPVALNTNTPYSLVTIPTITIKRPAFRKIFHFWLFTPLFSNIWHILTDTLLLAPSLFRDALFIGTNKSKSLKNKPFGRDASKDSTRRITEINGLHSYYVLFTDCYGTTMGRSTNSSGTVKPKHILSCSLLQRQGLCRLIIKLNDLIRDALRQLASCIGTTMGRSTDGNRTVDLLSFFPSSFLQYQGFTDIYKKFICLIWSAFGTVKGLPTSYLGTIAGHITDYSGTISSNSQYPLSLLLFRDVWCQFSIVLYQELQNVFDNFRTIYGRLWYDSGTVNNVFASLPREENIQNSVRKSKQKYVAISNRPNKRKHQNHVIRIDSKKFKKFSKQSHTHYSDNVLSQQDELWGLLDDTKQPLKVSQTKKVQNKKAATHKVPTHKNIQNSEPVKNEPRISAKKKVFDTEPVVPNKGANLNTVLSYCYPNDSYEINVYSTVSIPKTISFFNELSAKQQLFLVNLAIANLYIYRYYLTTTQTAEYSDKGHLAIPFKCRYDINKSKIQRGTDLIANPSFDLCNYDFRSFNQQFGFKTFAESKDLPFVADEMISFSRNGRKHEVFLELDNRTEANNTQIQKIMNYIWYSLENPEKDIDMIIAITDGSLKSKRVPEYTNIGRKLGNLATQFIRTYLDTQSQKRVYLANLYKRATNLHIYLTGVSEAHIDIASILLGTNSVSDRIVSAMNLANVLSHKTRWSVKYIPSSGVSALLGRPDLMFATGNSIDSPIINKKAKGIFRYIDDEDDGSTLGMLRFTDKITGSRSIQTIVNANEHDLDTIIATYNLISSQPNQKSYVPICVFPHRIGAVTAISLPSYAKKMKYTQGYSSALSYFIQPRYEDNLSAHELERWITVQYPKEIQNYYLIGAINKSALKKNPNYGNEYPKLLIDQGKARSYEELKNLASGLSADKFVDQLRLDEIPTGLFKALASRWPSQAYCIPRFMTLPFVKNPNDLEYFKIKDHYEFQEFIHGLNSTLPDKRSNLF